MNKERRKFFGLTFASVASIVVATLVLALPAASGADKSAMKIGIIGSGKIGGTLGELWVKAGHEVFFSSRHPDELQGLVKRLGSKAHAGMPREAAKFGEVVLISVPYGALPQIGKDLAAELSGKVVIETGNPVPRRDGPMAEPARAKGTGVASAEFLPGTRLVRAFNTVEYEDLRSNAHRAGERVAIPLAGDDKAALEIASRLVEDAGFEPVVVGSLARAKDFDTGTPVYRKALTARELRQSLGINPTSKP
jgi:8-hydroxy-5-deazaflavin:NADPH oxidoreductase